MKLFQDISNFSNTNDYLPIINGVLFTETIAIYLALDGLKHSKILQQWYNKYKLSAVLADISIVTIIIIVTRFLYHYFFKTFSIWTFILLAIIVQIIHDLFFYAFFTITPRGINSMLDLFKDYAKEMSYYILLGDSIIITLACLFASNLGTYSLNLNIVTFFFTLYFIPFMIH
jgi:hypothetical protein